MAPEPLSRQEIDNALAELPGWSAPGDRLERTYTFEGHLSAAATVAQIARVQETLNHHADLTLSYNKLKVSVNTHSVGGKITELDLELAHRIEQICVEHHVS
ncbi:MULTISPECIES: 4a-hydroxytetrahydrobiopterin dehydratase [Streptomyces]|uniref:Putative pterin-4-alpha-carbinolamine dehydratase n=1 Tax=Streptomyces lycii TaxID=2654337 RepID=A0ABQ7FPH7_9ACTN|nr:MULTISPECIES: 4a-hydroxytetrahydrobiopterin dehydratase [Streptomyces]KAF4409671.1 4a-hydroxytetrahydrobiopterin dehydratase [Streptomyces lycii]PGH47795.1 4a-hydroxytetrahydrobiopterin dehydratase [Streptomyces sp. Ru87]